MTRKGEKFHWTPKYQRSFEELKDRLTCAPILALSSSGKDFVVYCNALGVGLGRILIQQE